MIVFIEIQKVIKAKLGYPTLIYNEQEIVRSGEITALPCVLVSIEYEDEKVEGTSLYATMMVKLHIISQHTTTTESFLKHQEISSDVFAVVNRLSGDGEFNSLMFQNLHRSFKRENTRNADVLITTQIYKTYGRVYSGAGTLYAHDVKPIIK